MPTSKNFSVGNEKGNVSEKDADLFGFLQKRQPFWTPIARTTSGDSEVSKILGVYA